MSKNLKIQHLINIIYWNVHVCFCQCIEHEFYNEYFPVILSCKSYVSGSCLQYTVY